MILARIAIQHVRNLDSVEISPSRRLNLITGENGAGKTAILEAIHLLSHGRSFRSSSVQPLIAHKKSSLLVTGRVIEGEKVSSIGIERSLARMRARINGESLKTILQISEHLATLVIHPGTFDLLNGAPEHRRSLMDWGVFYRNPDFRYWWQDYKRALKQRNAALLQGQGDASVSLWHEKLALAGTLIAQARQEYMRRLSALIPELMDKLDVGFRIDFQLRQGWPHGVPLGKQLEQALHNDRKSGFTRYGPHRGDFQILLNGYNMSRYASRGQIKFVCLLLKIAQVIENKVSTGRSCVLLLDDLKAELDTSHLNKALAIINDLGVQSFVSALDAAGIEARQLSAEGMFHVKHGQASAMV